MLIKLQNRIGILELRLNIVSLEAGRDRQPGSHLAESRIDVAIPLHGGAFAIATFLVRPAQLADRILYILFALGIVVLYANFFAVVHDGRAAQSQVHAGHEFGNLVIVLTVAVAAIRTHDVVIANNVHWPAS